MRATEWLTIAEAAKYLSTQGEAVSGADVLRLAQEGVLRLSVRLHKTVYGEDMFFPTDPKVDLDRVPIGEGVYTLPMAGAARLAVEEAYRRQTGERDVVLNHHDPIVIEDDSGLEYRIYHRPGDYSPITRLPDHAVLLVRRDELEQLGLEPPMTTRERETLYRIIVGLLRLAKLDIRQPGKVALALEPVTADALREPIPERTVQHHLQRARELLGIPTDGG